MSSAPLYCTNHPKTETLLRCNRCGKPYCIRCLERTPVGYRCRECLNIQQAGYYTATPLDFAIAGAAATLGSIVGGAIAAVIGGLGLFALLIGIFFGPAAGGAIAEIVHWSIQKRRGKYIWVAACAGVLVGGLIGAGLLPLLGALLGVGRAGLAELVLALPVVAVRAIFNLGFLIYIVLAVGTVYARLRN